MVEQGHRSRVLDFKFNILVLAIYFLMHTMYREYIGKSACICPCGKYDIITCVLQVSALRLGQGGPLTVPRSRTRMEHVLDENVHLSECNSSSCSAPLL